MHESPATQVRLTIRFREKTRDAVVARYHPDVMKGGMLIRTREHPMIVLGTYITLRFLLAGGEEIFHGEGLVAWTQRRGGQLGVGIHFLELSPNGDELYREMLAQGELARMGLHRSPFPSAKPSTEQLLPDDDDPEQEFLNSPTWPRHTPA